jgi:glutamate-1-semialdehyde 2,1-aminomutase
MTTSETLFARAQQVIPGGVNSPVRAFSSVGGTPAFMARGCGSRMFTADGAELVDFCCSWGPLILGHAREEVVAAVADAAANGMSFGASTEREIEMAELLCGQIDGMERVRLVSSGTEATMTALRLARGATGRQKIVKFDGNYHGHGDQLLVAAGSGLLTGGIASSAGVADSVAADVFVVPYNDLPAVEAVFAEHGAEIAALIVEPIAGNMGLVMPAPGFLEGLRAVTAAAGSVLIFDEVIAGFRVGPTSYGNICGVAPDLTCLGKIVGGGLPIGAIGGGADLMEQLAPNGSVYQAGTLSGNPVAVAAGLATLRILRDDSPYARIADLAKAIADGVNALASERGGGFHCAQFGSMMTTFFTDTPVTDLAAAKTSDTERYKAFFHHMLSSGIYLAPSQFELGFTSAAHTQVDVDAFLTAARAFDG